MVDDWAADGFVVSAPDIFWRVHPGPTAEQEVAFGRYEKFDPDQGMLDIEDLVKDLKSRPQCNGKVAMLGYCFGGRYAHLGAARLGIDAAGSFHGTKIGLHVDELHIVHRHPDILRRDVSALQGLDGATVGADVLDHLGPVAKRRFEDPVRVERFDLGFGELAYLCAVVDLEDGAEEAIVPCGVVCPDSKHRARIRVPEGAELVLLVVHLLLERLKEVQGREWQHQTQ